MEIEDYYNWKGLENLYLEDSWVLDIIEDKNEIVFYVDFVLTVDNPNYSIPKKDKQYCYKKGYIKIMGIKHKRWIEKDFRWTVDPDGEKDLGNIDGFYKENDMYYIEGSFGTIEFQCDKIEVEYE